MQRAALFLLIICSLLSQGNNTAQRQDILVADFEGADYGAWKVEGTAFGRGPAHGTLPNQMPVSGFLGKGLRLHLLALLASSGKISSTRR